MSRLTSRKSGGVGLRSSAASPDDAPAVEVQLPRSADRPLLGDVLIARGLVTESQLEEALTLQSLSGTRLGETLASMGVLSERDCVDALAEQFSIPVADLGSVNPEPAALACIPEQAARELLVLPITLIEGRLRVAAAEPSEALTKSLREIAGQEITLTIAPFTDLRRAIDRNYRALGGVDTLVKAFETFEGERKRSTDTDSVERTAVDAPIVQVVTRILTQALRDRASDIHLEPQDDVIRVRFRIDGVLNEMLTLPSAMAQGLLSRIKIMADMNIVERRRAQDGQFTAEVDGRSVDVRVATIATIWGEKCVMRILDKTRSIFRLDDLGMNPETDAQYSKMIRSPFGMVLCAGPTGSGKTTTLYATLSEVNESSRNIMTIEDPVENVFPSINQIQTNEAAGITFAAGLRAILRQDPDAIMVGEIRDVETARVAVQAALTGHFVCSSLHATDAVSALHRFLDMGIESFLLASSILGVVGQRLVRRVCPSCRERYTPSQEELTFYIESGGKPKTVFWRGSGCNFCSGTGFQGRIGVYEILPVTPEIKRLIVGWATQDELRRLAQKQGMRTLREEALALVMSDMTTISEVIRNIYAL